MQILGENIGKYITINANITNSMNGRVISRILQQIQNDRDFAFNSQKGGNICYQIKIVLLQMN